MTGSFVEDKTSEANCFKVSRHESFDARSECSTTSGGTNAARLNSFSDQDEEDFVQTLTFVDWDDTLFPTTWLQEQELLQGDFVVGVEQREWLEKLAIRVEITLRLALQFGRVVIVTNAQQGWVEKCCTEIMPSLSEVLDDVDVISARSTYETCSGCPSEWKRLAFEQELLGSSIAQYNVLSLGDSMHEQRALLSLCQKKRNCFGKSMKFLEAPSIEQLIEQHDFVVSCFLEVAEHNGNLDVEIAL